MGGREGGGGTVGGKLPARRALLFSFLVYGEFFKRERKQAEGRKWLVFV